MKLALQIGNTVILYDNSSFVCSVSQESGSVSTSIIRVPSSFTVLTSVGDIISWEADPTSFTATTLGNLTVIELV